MICRNGSRECDGCMFCYDDGDRPAMECAECGKTIYAGDDFYRVVGDSYCDKCVSRETAE